SDLGLADKTRALVVKLPSWDQILHRHGVVAGADSHLFVQRVRLLDLNEIRLNAEPRTFGHPQMSISNFQGVLREALPVVPNPVSVDGSDLARRCRGNMGEHRERNVEVIVGVRSPSQAPRLANLCYAN